MRRRRRRRNSSRRDGENNQRNDERKEKQSEWLKKWSGMIPEAAVKKIESLSVSTLFALSSFSLLVVSRQRVAKEGLKRVHVTWSSYLQTCLPKLNFVPFVKICSCLSLSHSISEPLSKRRRNFVFFLLLACFFRQEIENRIWVQKCVPKHRKKLAKKKRKRVHDSCCEDHTVDAWDFRCERKEYTETSEKRPTGHNSSFPLIIFS